MTLTLRDIDISVTFARLVRLMTLDVAAKLWWPQSRSSETARHRLRTLAREGWVQLATVNLTPMILGSPLAVWSPGQPEPDAERIAELAQSRWTEPARPTSVVLAGPRAANVFGSTAGTLSAVHHRDHDAYLGLVYAHYREHRSEESSDWLGEDARPKAGHRIKDPDALLVNSNGQVYRVVECAGRYSVSQVQAFHEHCVDHELPYELW